VAKIEMLWPVDDEKSMMICLAVSTQYKNVMDIHLTLSLPLATTVDTVPVPLATKVDRMPSLPLAMIVGIFTNVRGIACFQIFTPRNPALGARKSAAKELRHLTTA